MSRYFLTGGTGVVGSAVVSRLISEGQAHVDVLVRGRSREEAATRLHRILGSLGGNDGEIAKRVTVLVGDAEQEYFGLSSAEFQALVQRTTHIVHCAGVVRMNLPLSDARRAALEPTHNVIRLAKQAQRLGMLQKCEFVSTVGVAGCDIRELPEAWIHRRRRFHNTYEQAKAEAEAQIEAAVGEGLPITVHRPSMVVGDSTSGEALRFQVFYHLVEFLSGRRTSGFTPRFAAAKLDIVPVDFVAKALMWSSRNAATAGRVLHLCSGPQAIRLADLQRLVCDTAREMGASLPALHSLPTGAFRAVASALALWPGKGRKALKTLPIFLDYLESDQSFSNAGTNEILARAGIPIPEPNAYVPRLLRRYFAERAAQSLAA